LWGGVEGNLKYSSFLSHLSESVTISQPTPFPPALESGRPYNLHGGNIRFQVKKARDTRKIKGTQMTHSTGEAIADSSLLLILHWEKLRQARHGSYMLGLSLKNGGLRY